MRAFARLSAARTEGCCEGTPNTAGRVLEDLALLVPREHKVELTNAYEGLSTEQIEAYIAAIQDRIDRRAAGHQAKVIDGEAVGRRGRTG